MEGERIRDGAGWRTSLLALIPAVMWLAICAYSWSVDDLDRFQIISTIFIVVAYVYCFSRVAASRVLLTAQGIVIRIWKSRQIAWTDVAGFEPARHPLFGRTLYLRLKSGGRVQMPYPSPGNVRYDENVERLRRWHSAHGEPRAERQVTGE
jgi:hypothetical protein